MRLSAFMFLTDETIGPIDLAVGLEQRGFAGLWVPEHPHIPTKRETPVPPAYGGGDLATFYLRLLDPFVALTAAAAVTTTLRLGTGICLLALRDPIVTAKEVATLDHLSGGRFDFGVGYGWNADEFPDHAQHFEDRHRLVREKVALMRRLWTDDEASYSGGGLDMQPSWAWPKPAPAPMHVWLGGNGRYTMREAARWADVWYPTPSAADMAAEIAMFRSIVAEEGRDPASASAAICAAPADAGLMESCAAAGAVEYSVALPVAGRDEVLTALDSVAALRDRVFA